MKHRKKVMALIIVIIFCLAGFVAFFELIKEEIPEIETDEIPVFDDRISPFLNQGLVVEIKRIRNRGLMDKMLTFGNDWKNKPTFFWVCTVDGRKHVADEIWSAGGVEGTGSFTEWDTLGKESKGNFFVEEEQETSDVTITIMEKTKSGLFSRHETNVEKEIIRLTYDYRTGHWSGDDHLKDRDGYGHVLGDEYEVWFNIYQSDFDNDFIPFWAEVNLLGTSPFLDNSNQDPDNDGIPSSWEWKWGYDPLAWDNHEFLDPDIDGLENIEEYMMRKYFADPFHQDIYIEIDGMKKPMLPERWHSIFNDESQQMIIERFSQHNINVYFDDGWPDGPNNKGGEFLPYMKVNDDTVGHFHNRFYVHNFADERKGVFRYCTVAINAGFITPGNFNHYDHIVVDNGLRVTLKRIGLTPKYRRVLLAKGILHELGHSIGLMPTTYYGIDIMPGDWKGKWPNELSEEEYEKYAKQYYSIMNYGYIFGITREQIRCFDYSDGSNGAPYDQNDWAHIYLPAFQTEQASYEEAQPTIDETFEDMEIVKKERDVVLDGWMFDKNLSMKYAGQLSELTHISNAYCTFRVLVKQNEDTEEQAGIRNVLIFARPIVEPVVTVWTLVAEGNLNEEKNKIKFHSFDEQYANLMSTIQ